MVSVINRSTVVSDSEIARIVELTNLVMARDFAPAYERLFGPGHWQYVVGGNHRIKSYFVDTDKDVPGALAFHDLQAGVPVLFTLAGTILQTGAAMFGPDGVLSAHLHEAEETFNDAACNLTARGPDGRVWWREVCDAVQGMDYKIGGTDAYAPNFCKAHWFNPDSPDDDVDHVGGLSEPFTVAPHGYQVVASCGGEQQVGGLSQPIVVDADGNQRGGGPNAWRTLKITGVR